MPALPNKTNRTGKREHSLVRECFGCGKAIAAIAMMMLLGCAGKGRMPTYPLQSIPPLSDSGQVIAPQRWWTTFEDAGLDEQVNLALGQNFDLSAALQQLRAAQALTRRQASDLRPDLDGFINDQNSFGPGPNDSRLNWGLEVAYQVDLWGQIRARIDAERFRAEATRADYHAVALVLSAEIAATWFALIESRAQLELLQEQVATNENGLKAVELRYREVGEGGSPNVLRQRQLVESTLEQIVVVKSNVEVLEHRLAVLTGQPPQVANYDTGSQFPKLPQLPFTGLPSELLTRRPDVLSRYLALAAADQDLAVAVLDQYPKLDLAASLVNTAEHPETLFRDWFLSIGGQLLGPILDGGQRRAEVQRQQAIVCQRFSEYRQSLLVALQEVEDGLALERYQLERIEKIEAQVELAKTASERLLQYFITGDATYLDVLSANQSQQRLQRALLSARLELLLIRINLYLALAGGFDTRPQYGTELPFGLTELDSGLQSQQEQPGVQAASVGPIEEASPSKSISPKQFQPVSKTTPSNLMLLPALEMDLYD